MTQRDGMGSEVGEGFRIGNTYHSVLQTRRLRPREIRGLAEPGVQQQWLGSGATCLSTR